MISFLSLFDPMEWLTIGLVVFAGAQIWIMHAAVRRDNQHRAEVKATADETAIRQNTRAYQRCVAEALLLIATYNSMRQRDLVWRAYLGALEPERFQVDDWGALLASMGSLSEDAAFSAERARHYGVLAQRGSRSLIRRIREAQVPRGVSAADAMEFFGSHPEGVYRSIAEGTQDNIKKMAVAIDAAIRAIDRDIAAGQITLRGHERFASEYLQSRRYVFRRAQLYGLRAQCGPPSAPKTE